MNRNEFMNEIEEIYNEVKNEEKFMIEIELTNGECYTISTGNSYLGGNREYFISNEIGHIQYNDIFEISDEVYNKIEDNNYKIKNISVNS